MQTANVNVPVNITVRHESITDSLRNYVHKKIEGLHLDYPKIIEAKAVLDVQKNRHIAEIILYCANHITIDASSETHDGYQRPYLTLPLFSLALGWAFSRSEERPVGKE